MPNTGQLCSSMRVLDIGCLYCTFKMIAKRRELRVSFPFPHGIADLLLKFVRLFEIEIVVFQAAEISPMSCLEYPHPHIHGQSVHAILRGCILIGSSRFQTPEEIPRVY
jgi:hypothetical protein